MCGSQSKSLKSTLEAGDHLSLIDLELDDAYDSGDDSRQILRDFFVPALKESIQYDRLTGYFAPGVIAMAARGIAGLIAKGGRMRLVTSPAFAPEEIEALAQAQSPELVNELIVGKFRSFCDNADLLAGEIERNYVSALGWMLKEGHLEIRVIVPREVSQKSRIFHSKVGILYDEEGNCLSFSGSINETIAGWKHNIEEFKVFRSWQEGTSSMVRHDQSLFERYWSPAKEVDFSTFEVPPEAKRLLVERAPESIEDLYLPDSDEEVAAEDQAPLELWEYQKEAIQAWWANDRRGILAMATGAGKTKTAAGAIKLFQDQNTTSITVVTVPYQHIAVNWEEDLAFTNPISTYGSRKWKEKLADEISKLRAGRTKHLTVIAIQNTAASDEFITLTRKAFSTVSGSLFVGDEAHGLGAPVFRRAMQDEFQARLALSATPERRDEEGSEALLQYFDRVVFEFSIQDGLNWINPLTGQSPLCPYDYEPVFVGLDDDELEEWISLTKGLLRAGRDAESEERRKRLLIKRAAIAKSANQKIPALAELLDRLGSINHCLIYCSDSEQMEAVMEILNNRSATYRRFTGREGTKPVKEHGGISEREKILQSFASGDTEYLVAMKCLDEGVDVPSAETGIILASSANRREFVQRRGRLLRRSHGKSKAKIYDFIVAPSFSKRVQPALAEAAARVIRKELDRVEEFAATALNSAAATAKVVSKMTVLGGVR